MPELKLIYFNMRGRAELIRWILSYGNISFTDDRIEKEDWPERKKSIYTGKVPVLMVDGQPLPESKAIARYVARLAGLVPEDSFQAAICDSLVDSIHNVASEGYKFMYSSMSEEDKIKEYTENYYPKVIKPTLDRLEEQLKDRNWFCGDKISWVDLMASLLFGEMRKRKPGLLESYPGVAGIVDKVRELPAIKTWIENSPQTQY